MVAIKGVFGICLLLFGGAHVSSAMNVDIPQKVYKVARGDNATIPCTFTPQAADAMIIVTWSTSPDVPDGPEITIATFFYNSPTSTKLTINKKYKGKANVVPDFSRGTANLQLATVTNVDTRLYECKVQAADDEDGGQSDSANLVVLVPPSTPICKIIGVAEYGQNINLTCRSEEGTPSPIYKWQSHDVNSIPRPNPPKTTDQNGILSLYNISQDTSGYYICTSTNEIRSAKCNLTLATMPPSMNMASTFGILGAVAAAILILGIIIFCCCCRRKNKPEEYAMGTPEGGEYTDKDPKATSVNYEEERRVQNTDRLDPRDDRSERSYDRRSDYDDRRRDDSDRRERYERDDRYDDRSDRHDDRRDRNDDRRDRYDSDRYSDRYDSPPDIPPNKPREQRN